MKWYAKRHKSQIDGVDDEDFKPLKPGKNFKGKVANAKTVAMPVLKKVGNKVGQKAQAAGSVVKAKAGSLKDKY